MKHALRAAMIAALFILVPSVQAQRAISYTKTGTIAGTDSITGIVGPYSTADYAMASVSISGTYAGVSAVFEFSDGSGNWYPAFGTRTDAAIQETGPTAISNVARVWDVSLFGTSQFRVRATNWESGTANVTIVISTTPVEVASTVTTAPGSVVQVTGSLTANPNLIQVLRVNAPPPLTPQQMLNPLMYRAAMRVYCQTNLAGCAPGL